MKQSVLMKWSALGLIIVAAGITCAGRLSAAKPNVILVMADDLGIGDVSPTNPECRIKTPCLQKMADELSRQLPVDSRMSYIENGRIKVGVDLNRGGAIVFLAAAGEDNLINNFDRGRQVQLSFYAGPVPFTAAGQRPNDHWRHLGWNPIQAGDDFGNKSRVLEHRNDGRTLYIRTRPLHWPLNNVPGECTFESWIALDGNVVQARARLNNARTDRTRYPARLQELPAVYANAAFHRVLSYTGDQPFRGDQVTPVPRAAGSHPWSFWLGTENWSALLDRHDRGLGLITPGRFHFTGGFAGQPGVNDTRGRSTAYVAGQSQEILDHNITFEYRYELVVGSLQEIRARAATHRVEKLPQWNFTADRQGWHLRNATDAGWPVDGHLHVILDAADPQLVSPYFFLRAEKAPVLVVDAAIRSRHRNAAVYWQKHGKRQPAATDVLTFPIEPDGQFRQYTLNLSEAAGYRGGITRLRFDPVPAGASGEWVRIRSIRFKNQQAN